MTRTVDLPGYWVRAAILPSTINPETRTVEVTFSTGAPVTRFDWMTGELFVERLSMKPEHVRLDRLNNGAPVLDSHMGDSLRNQLGVVEDGSAKVNGRKGTATLRFSMRDEVTPIWRDIEEGIYRNVSIGYATYKANEKPAKDGGLPERLATDWEPYEISMVPMPADAGAQTRDGKPTTALHRCTIATRLEESDDMEPTITQPESIVTRDPNDPGAPLTPATLAIRAEPETPNDRDRGVQAENDRVLGIMTACEAARMSGDFQRELIASRRSLVECQAAVFEELKRRGYDQAGTQMTSVRERSLDGDPNIHQTEGIRDALLHRMNPTAFPLTEKGRVYRGLSLLDVARLHIQARGRRTTDMTRNDIAAEALGLRGVGLHTTSDFPYLLADVASKSLKAKYGELPQSWRQMATARTLPNYRTSSIIQVGDAPELLEVGEHGEYKSGTVSEAREQWRIRKYGRKFGLTREAMINDDLDALTQIPENFGRKARALESDLVWEQITSNPTMGDGNTLFHADHGNIAATDGDISIATLGEARQLLREQTGVDGEYLDLAARFLIVPPGQETLAEQFVSVITAQTSGNVNPFQGKLIVVTDPRLTNDDEWYVATGPDFGWLLYAYLEGEQGPQVETRNGFDIDGLEFKCRLDFAAKVADWRGIVRNEGSTGA